jgi:hypothetical protein
VPPQTARHEEPVAIIGMACRFPGGADNPEALWQMLATGVDPVVEIPAERWPVDDFYDTDRTVKGKSVKKANKKLRAAGCTKGKVKKKKKKKHAKRVTRQNPSAGTEVPPGTPVELILGS